MKKIIIFLFFTFMLFKISASEINLAPSAKSAILIEYTTGKIIYEKNSNEKRSPASMTKMMTLLLTMESINNGNINYNDKVTISKNASDMGGTQIFLEEKSEIDILTLVKGITIASANDASVAIAEYIGGNEENFVLMMNKKAKEIGCENTNFKNPHGLDEEGHYSTAYDMSLIAKELIKYEEILKFTSTYEDNIMVSGKNQWIVNTNKLVKFYKGIDGLKTGYTDNALYCLTATMKKNNMRLISVVMGENSKENRNSDTISMMEYGYSMYGSKIIIEKDKYEKTIIIDNAKNRKVKYYLKDDVSIILDKNRKNVDYTLEEKIFDTKAPISKNTKIGILKVTIDNNEYNYDLIVKEDIEKSSYFGILYNIFKEIICGKQII